MPAGPISRYDNLAHKTPEGLYIVRTFYQPGLEAFMHTFWHDIVSDVFDHFVIGGPSALAGLGYASPKSTRMKVVGVTRIFAGLMS